MANLCNVGSAGWRLERLSALVCLFSKQINFEERVERIVGCSDPEGRGDMGRS